MYDSFFWQYIDETEELAMNGLVQNRHILDMIARELLENSRITGLVCFIKLCFCSSSFRLPVSHKSKQNK